MPNFGYRTVHWKHDEKASGTTPDSGGYVIHWDNGVWRPALGFTSVMTGDRVYVTVNENGTITVRPEHLDTSEVWAKDEAA